MTESDDSRVGRAMTKPLSERLERWLAPWVCNVNDEMRADIREAAALARRVEGAGIAHVEPKNGVAVIHERAMPLDLIGQRVRLVPEVGS